MCLSGAGHIAALWLRDLNGAAILDAVQGSVYLILGIGLFGQSRLSLVLALLVPAAAIAFVVHSAPEPVATYRLRSAVDGLIIVLCLCELWRVRHNKGG